MDSPSPHPAVLPAPGSPDAPGSPGSEKPPVSRRYAWTVFALAFALMLTDFVDRQIIVATFPLLKEEWGLSDTRLGALVSVVSVTVALGALPFALVADRWSRAKSIAVMGTVWSLAAMACAVVGNYAQLLAARAAIGLGEAGYGPAGGALMAGLFPQRLRATVVGALQAAGPLGVVLGVFLGGLMVPSLGWRMTLAVFAAPGLLLALLFLKVREGREGRTPVASPADAAAPADAAPIRTRGALAELFRSRTAVASYLGGAMQLVVLSTLYAWLPSYLTRTHDYTSAKAGAVSAAAVVASAVGTVVLGYAADRAGAARARRKLTLPAGLALLALVLLTSAFAWVPAGPVQLVLIVAGAFTVTAAVGPVPAVVMDVVDPKLRATALGMVTLIQNLFGLAVGPLLTGWLSDTLGIAAALALMPLFCAGAAAALWTASRSYERELRTDADGATPQSAAL
ncbi:MFS transporter [Streptomyces sp. SKN60]|uniref:MFS transporter n=1 Tax=Streptomyces sp. SKN60 TaxID=2855506 RepID=UPI00224867DA|nr:MFS transporter [Streptomyces sp. SKN60]MCX2180665.1 MFS transporter [Streptomyces sp. SKN60]